MLRNLNQPKLCNGTRLAVKKIMKNVIEDTIIIGKFKDNSLMPTEFAFEFKRYQFAVRLAFAMSINKSQGQSLEVCGINLVLPCFSHGQLYVACPRIGKPSALFVFSPYGKTKDIVHYNALILLNIMFCTDGKISVRINLPLFYTVLPPVVVSVLKAFRC